MTASSASGPRASSRFDRPLRLGFAILCRHGSSRLPGKILIDVGGHSVLTQIHERVALGNCGWPIVVATSNDPSDDPVAVHCAAQGYACYRGSLHNVAARFLGCAKTNRWDFVFRVNGDNLFASPDAIRRAVAAVETDAFDFVSNVNGRTYPTGMSVEAVRVSFYEDLLSRFREPGHFEHVTSYLYENRHVGRRFDLVNENVPEARGRHLALDTHADLELAKWMLARSPGGHLRYDLSHWCRLLLHGAR